ncbi:LysE family translocator [Telmatospirillum siberiense]|uniref:Lysine transporter LysE n=1 Tax=Telmatospirillum siberiense TaxID=382514 RepID=A0A2N3PV19_9PROT|nr:LysE family translocator [Telmatospirillum siberiense]PKU24253.1 lysine transporter LysE [Telmatospirillum siberiense]
MLDLGQAAAFFLAAGLITLAPGPDNLMVLGLGLSRGRRQGMIFGLGCALGCLSHTVLAALGLSALIAASPVLFTALRVAGGLYLLWLGVGALRGRGGAAKASAVEDGQGRLFLKGLMANAINPKVVLFFLAFLPQFVDAAKGGIVWQILQLGVLFTLQAAVQFAAIGWFSGSVGRWLSGRPKAGTWLDRVAGGVFLLFGLRLIFVR